MDTLRVFSYNPGLKYPLLFLAIGLFVSILSVFYGGSGKYSLFFYGGICLSWLSIMLIIRNLFIEQEIVFKGEGLLLPTGFGRMFPKLIPYDTITETKQVGDVFPSKVLRVITKTKAYEISAYLLSSDAQYVEMHTLLNEKIS